MYRYDFTSSIEDLLEAEEVERASRSVGKPVRYAILAMGAMWLAAGLLTLRSPSFGNLSIVWIALGIGVVYFMGISIHLKRNRIRRANPSSIHIALEFREDCLEAAIGDLGKAIRKWDELVTFADNKKGVLLFFTDGVVNWLPGRVFADMEEKKALIQFLENRIATRAD